MSTSPALALSPGFGRARALSRVMTVIFTIAFFVMLTALISAPVMAAFPGLHGGIGLPHGIRIPIGELRGWAAIGAMAVAMLLLLPIILMLHHARKLFACFAKGEVFAVKPIAHIRAAGLWLTISFFTDVGGVALLRDLGIQNRIGVSLPAMPPAHAFTAPEFLGVLFTGIATTIAAYVMAEARRIADENASIL